MAQPLAGGITRPETCFNDTDPITLNDLKPLSDDAVIRVPGPDGKFYCFQKPSLQNWRKVNPTKNPATNLEWTEAQQTVIENELGLYWAMKIDMRVRIDDKYVVDKENLITQPRLPRYRDMPFSIRHAFDSQLREKLKLQLQTVMLEPFHRDVRIVDVIYSSGIDDYFVPAPGATVLAVYRPISVLAFAKNSNVYLAEPVRVATFHKIGVLAATAFIRSILKEERARFNLPIDFFVSAQGVITRFETRSP